MESLKTEIGEIRYNRNFFICATGLSLLLGGLNAVALFMKPSITSFFLLTESLILSYFCRLHSNIANIELVKVLKR